jgi:uncharacterized membrane protein HdeD (DUF308 family)
VKAVCINRAKVQGENMLSPVMSSRSLMGRGVAALILGIVALLTPGPMLVGVTLLMGGYLLVNGISALAFAIKREVKAVAGCSSRLLSAFLPELPSLAGPCYRPSA